MTEYESHRKLILTVNAGSNSLKCSLCEVDGKTLCFSFEADRIQGDTTVTIKGPEDSIEIKDEPISSGHESALNYFIGWFSRKIEECEVLAVGHRIVHGGEKYAEPVILDEDVLSYLETFSPLAPSHQPVNLELVKVAREFFKDALHIGCFDTAFHAGLPEEARTYALPAELCQEHHIRKFGFHGLSYEYIAGQLSDHLKAEESGKVIVVHLGSGASACALKDGKSVDTTMGMTALDGLVMSTRPGRLDPGIVVYLLKEGMSAGEIEDVLYKDSGLKGVSAGLSADMRDLQESDKPEARAAVNQFCYQAAREIAGLIPALGGVDSIIFTGAMGSNDAEIRRRICDLLGWLGVKLDKNKNEQNMTRISNADSKIAVLALPTNEECMMALHAASFVDREEMIRKRA